MPLSFDTLNRGPVAFGFFNVQSDMLLLDRHFFFADAFCREVEEAARREPEAPFEACLGVFTIDAPERVGDLTGAIHGVRFTGFIGETYRRFPFPSRPEDFRQRPEGSETREELREMIAPHAREEEIPFAWDPGSGEVALGAYRFSRRGFHRLVRYVWRGGYPRWRDDVRPDYVLALKAASDGSPHRLLAGLSLEYGT